MRNKVKLGSILRRRLQALLTFGVVGVFAIYFIANSHKFTPLLDVKLGYLVLIACLNIVAIFMNGIFIKSILLPFRKVITLSEAFYVSLISSVGNFFAPVGGGFGFRAVYLKKKHGLSYGDFISTLYGNYIIVFLVNSFFALVSLYLLRERASTEFIVLFIIFSGIFLVSLFLSIVRVPTLKRELSSAPGIVHRMLTSAVKIVQGWNNIISNKKLLMRLIGITAVNFIITISVAWLEISALNFSISLPALLLFSVLGSLSLFVNITPANLGVKEAIYIFSGSVIGFSASQILLIALVDRGVLFIVLFSSWLIMPRLKKRQEIMSSISQ